MLSFFHRRSVASALGRGVELAVDLRFLKLPRWRKSRRESSVAFFNKRFGFRFLWATLFLLSGLGGEGDEKRCTQLSVRSSYLGGEADTPLKWEILLLAGAPWWSSSTTGTFRCCFNNCPFRLGDLGSEATCLLWRGGSGEEDWSSRSEASWGVAANFRVHQRWRICAVVISSRWGYSEPWCCSHHDAFNLQAGVPLRRPLSSSMAAPNVELFPSGIVPGDDADGRRVELLFLLGGEGLDCISI